MIAEQSKTAEYSTIGRGIAAALGRAWRFDPSDLTHIQGPRGRALRLQWEGWNNRGRVEVSGEYPPCPPEVGCSSSYVNRHGGDEWPSGTFAMSRGAEMIGRDVANRILPGYARLYPIIEGRIAAAMAEHRACVGLEHRLLNAIDATPAERARGGHRRGNDYGFHIYRSGVVKCSFYHSKGDDDKAEHVKMELSVTAAQAEQILRLLRP